MKNSRRICLLAMLTALALIFGWLETLIPLPIAIPGIKLGLSNIVLLFSLYILSWRDTLILLFVKVLLSSLLFSGFPAFVYAITGGIFAFAGMILLKQCKLSVVGVSTGGAVLHNIGQVVAAIFMLGTVRIVYLLAVLLLAGVATGALTGLLTTLILSILKKWQES